VGELRPSQGDCYPELPEANDSLLMEDRDGDRAISDADASTLRVLEHIEEQINSFLDEAKDKANRVCISLPVFISSTKCRARFFSWEVALLITQASSTTYAIDSRSISPALSTQSKNPFWPDSPLLTISEQSR
jgi:hypothetical protein